MVSVKYVHRGVETMARENPKSLKMTCLYRMVSGAGLYVLSDESRAVYDITRQLCRTCGLKEPDVLGDSRGHIRVLRWLFRYRNRGAFSGGIASSASGHVGDETETEMGRAVEPGTDGEHEGVGCWRPIDVRGGSWLG